MERISESEINDRIVIHSWLQISQNTINEAFNEALADPTTEKITILVDILLKYGYAIKDVEGNELKDRISSLGND